MNIFLTLLGIAALAVVLCCVGCTSNRPYRTSFAPCDTSQHPADCTTAVIETTNDLKLGFVEFDDQGWFWDRRQLDAVKKMIQTEAGIGQTNNPEGIVIVLFVHGWKNNAAYDNENVQMFRAALHQLNKTEQIQSGMENRGARKIVGV